MGTATSAQPAQSGFGRRHPILTGCLGIIVLIFLIGILGAALGGGGDETAGGGGGGANAGGNGGQQNENQGRNAGQGQEQGDGGQQAQGPARMGEEVVVGDIAYTVTNARQETVLEDPSGFDEPLEGNFIIVDFTVENRGSEPISVSDVGLYVYDSQGREFETETEVPLGYIPEDRDLFLMDRLNPGLSQNVRTVFTVPPDAQGFEMEVSSGLFGAETRRIDLGL